MSKMVACDCGGCLVQCPVCHGRGSFPEQRKNVEQRRFSDRVTSTELAMLRAFAQDAESLADELELERKLSSLLSSRMGRDNRNYVAEELGCKDNDVDAFREALRGKS